MSVLSSPFELPGGRLLALDLGQARHGVAVCDALGILASPLTTIARQKTREQDFRTIGQIVATEAVAGVLIGMPLDAGGEVGTMARWARRYGGRLAGTLSIPVAFWDETLTSVDAATLLAEGRGRSGVDAAAAAILLQEFLDHRRRSHFDRDVAGSRRNGSAEPGPGRLEPSGVGETTCEDH